MAQHDFVPAWLNFSTPQPAKSPAANLDNKGEPPHHRDGRAAVSRRRHNSSDGFFNNGSLRAPAGDGWQQPSLLLRHDSVDSGVAKGGHGGLAGGSCWKETPNWHGTPRGAQDSHHHQGRHSKRGAGDRDRQGGHRQRNGNFHPRKGTSYSDKFPNEERKDSKDDKLKFVEEDFPSLNPETTGKPGAQMRAVAPHAGVWENPPSGKQMVSKMLVIKKVSKEDPSTAFSAGFATAGALPTNGNKAPIASSSVYKNLVPKPAVAPTKSTQWKSSGREITKSGLHMPGRDSVFTSPVSAAKPSTPVSAPQHNTPKECPATFPLSASSRHSGHSRTSSGKSAQSSESSTSSRRTPLSSVGCHPGSALSSARAVLLEERIKQIELAELRQQIEEDSKVDNECANLKAKAKQGQRLQEEAQKAWENLSRQLDHRRLLQRAENELAVAKLVSSLLQEQEVGESCDDNASSAASLKPPPVKLDILAAPGAASPTDPWQSNPWKHNATILSPVSVTHLSAPLLAPVAYNPAVAPISNAAAQGAPAATVVVSHPISITQTTATATLGLLPKAITSVKPKQTFIVSTNGIPNPRLPTFESGRERDFALLKMALDNMTANHRHLSECYKYQLLLGQLKLPSARHLANTFKDDPKPYTTALQALKDKYGRPRKLVQSELETILSSPAIRFKDAQASYTLSVQYLVAMLRALEGQGGSELRSRSHVDLLLREMPPSYHDGFVEYCLCHGIVQTDTGRTYTLPDLATWLQLKAKAKRLSSRAAALNQHEARKLPKKNSHMTSLKQRTTCETTISPKPLHLKPTPKSKPYCPHCDNKEHFLNACSDFQKLTTSQIITWIHTGQRCWRCGRIHKAEDCTLKRPCRLCKELHLSVLHEVAQEKWRKVLTHPSSMTPPIDIAPSRLKLMRRGPDRKSEFLRALKDEGTGELTTSSSPGTSGEGESNTPEPKPYNEEVCHENGLSYSLSDSDTEHLSSSLEAEHRLLKAMGWQEYPENDDNFLPLTEDELREFQTKTEQLKRNGMQRNGVLPRQRGVTLHFTPWRSVAEAHVEEGSESETSSSSQTSDDDDCIKS